MMLQKRRTASAMPAVDHETVENDVRAQRIRVTASAIARGTGGDGDARIVFQTDSRNSVVGIGPLKLTRHVTSRRYSDKILSE